MTTENTHPRPEAWDDLFKNELELARRNYEKEEDRYKLIADKAKVTFAIAGLLAAFGFTKFGDIFTVLICTSLWAKWVAVVLLSVSYLSLTAAVFISLGVITVRQLKSLPDARKYVSTMYKNDHDAITRSLSSIYQRTAEQVNVINNDLARKVGWAMTSARIGFATAVLFFFVYGIAGWQQACISSQSGRMNVGGSEISTASKADRISDSVTGEGTKIGGKDDNKPTKRRTPAGE